MKNPRDNRLTMAVSITCSINYYSEGKIDNKNLHQCMKHCNSSTVLMHLHSTCTKLFNIIFFTVTYLNKFYNLDEDISPFINGRKAEKKLN